MTKKYSIGIIAPSLPSEGARAQKISAALKYLESLGHKIHLASSVFEIHGYKSSTARLRARELREFLIDPAIDLILTTTGGYNSNEMLEFLDLQSIPPSQKYFVGYSDCTVLSLALHAFQICKTISGPMLVDYVDYSECFDDLFSTLESPKRKLSNPNQLWESATSERICLGEFKTISNKNLLAYGPAVAGNLSTFNLLLGTPFLPDCTGAILFLEYDREEQRALPSIERFLWQLRHTGLLSSLSGLIFGALQPSVAAEETRIDTIERILTDVTDGFDYPVIYHAGFGHMYPSWVIMNGKIVEISKEGVFQ